MDKEKYRISVVTPVYNAAAYLEETLRCVEGQTIGYENIQHILINDGSTDSSDLICREYESRHPQNVVYIAKENGGVSSARNEGLRYIEGKYTVFLDGDDLWQDDAFSKIVDFFESNGDDFDVVACPIEYIGSFAVKEHPQNYKFAGGSRVVDLKKEPDIINTPIGNTAFRSASLEGHLFDKEARYCEDTLFENKIMAEKSKVGLIADAVFYYRKNAGGANASLTIPETPAWYFEVPETYYMNLISYAVEKFGSVPRFLQEVLIYDIKWRGYTDTVVETFTEEQKQAHIELMRKVLSYIDDEVILGTGGINQYKKLYILNLKLGKDVMKEAVFENDRFYYKGMQVLSLRGRSMMFIRAFDITDNVLSMEGVLRASATGLPYRLVIRDTDGNSYDPEIREYPKGDLKGYIGEIVSEGRLFYTRIPVRPDLKLYFYLILDGRELEFRPTFDDYIGIERGQRNNYAVKCGYIIKLRKNELSFYADTKARRAASELRLDQELFRKHLDGWAAERRTAVKMVKAVNDSRIKDRIAFISVRSDGKPKENLDMVYTMTDAPKAVYCDRAIPDDPAKALEAAKLLYSSKVVVTDDYLSLFRDNKKRPGQHYIQIWHAAGAFKKFGKDGVNTPPGMDWMNHRDYDLVAVSSEYVRDFYADAFQIDRERIRALGLPRSDIFFDEEYLRRTRESVFERMPELEGKQIILYSPTFRGKADRRVYMPRIDYAYVDSRLRDDQVLVLCPHPLMPPYEGRWDYDKIKLVRNITSNDMMVAADLMLTDYSSVIFEYSLLSKPIAFFCYDYDEYDRDFYLDYETDLPGEIFKTEEDLMDYIGTGRFETDDRLTAFREKYMSACDGNSSRRIAETVKEYLYK